MKGKIVKGIAGFYYVYTQEAGILECKARGIFRRQGVKPLVGDNVEVILLDEEEHTGNVEALLPRQRELVRPAVANVDQALVIFAAKKPDPSFNLLDRFLCMMEAQDVPVIICINKCDLATEEELCAIRSIYEPAGYPMIFTCAVKSANGKDNDTLDEAVQSIHSSFDVVNAKDCKKCNPCKQTGDDESRPACLNNRTGDSMYHREMIQLRSLLKGRTTTVAGPSGAGKSSLINALFGEQMMETQDVSVKLGRGKHTTRHSEILPLAEETFIVDTPGFSSLELPEISAEQLSAYYPEFVQYEPECRFRGCSHINEPDCAVKQALGEGKISSIRYDNYKLLYEELKTQRRY